MKRIFSTSFLLLLLAFGVAYLILYMVSKDLTWYQYFFVMLLFPSVLIIVNTTALTLLRTIPGKDFREIMKEVLSLLQKFISNHKQKRT